MTSSADPERLALVVHEVRSPSAALAAIASALADGSLDEGAIRELVALAVAACRGIERIVGDAALGALVLVAVDVGDLARSAAASAALGGARIRAVVSPEVPIVRADPLRLRQAVDNLVANAVAHSPAEEDVVVRVRALESSVLVSVEDAGAGIPAGSQERVFEPGVRLAVERPGSGLGLAVARSIVEEHGGRLTVESAPGEGAVFTIVLPITGRG